MLKHSKQRGAVLVVSLIILLVLTMLSLSTSRSSLMQEKMTFAVRDSHLALASADYGIKEAEAYIETLVSTTGFSDAGTGGLYTKDNVPTAIDALFNASTWVNHRTVQSPPTGVPAAVYFIEDLEVMEESTVTDPNIGGYGQTAGQGNLNGFRVYAKGQGKSADSERIIISYYGKRL